MERGTEITRLAVELHLGADLRAYVEGEAPQVPLLCLETDTVSLLVSPPDGPEPTAATIAIAEAIAQAASHFRDRVRELVTK